MNEVKNERPKLPENKYYAEGWSEPVTLNYSHIKWWRKDKFGFPIELIENRPKTNFIRVIIQNIRKITG